MNKVLVIGGAGYIGSHVCKELERQGFTPITLDNFSSGHRHFVKWGPLIEIDVRNSRDLANLFCQLEFHAVIHLAAKIEVGESVKDPESFYWTNVGGATSLLWALEQSGKRVPIVYTSTAAVYGDAAGAKLIDESHALKPLNPYGTTKMLVETLLREAAHYKGLTIGALRCFNVAGADPEGQIGESHEPETHLIPSILRSLTDRTRRFAIFGDDYPTPDGTCVRDFVHVMDLARAQVDMLRYLQGRRGFHTFNVGYSRGYSVREVLATAARVCGRPVPHEVLARRVGDPARLVSDARRAETALGWRPLFKADLQSIVAHAWQWHLKGLQAPATENLRRASLGLA